MDWVKLRPSAWWKATRGIPPDRRDSFMDEAMECVEEDKHGVNAFADALLDESNAFLDRCRKAGACGGRAKAANVAKRNGSTYPKQPLPTPTYPSQPLATPSDPRLPLPTPTHKQEHIQEQEQEPIHPDPIRAHAREAGEKPPQAAIPHSAAPARPVGAAKAANPPQHPPQPAPPPETPPAARNAVDGKPSGSGGGSRTGNGSAKPTPSGKAKSPFSWADLSEDKQRYVWTIAPTLLPQFAVWFCQEPDNEKAKAIYEKFCARFGAEPFRILLDKFVASVFAGEEPDNRGAAFMATVMAEGRGRQAELSKTGNKPNQTNKQNNQNKGENK